VRDVTQDINLNRVRRILLQKTIQKEILNRLFYYSLIDFASFEEDSIISPTMLDRYRKDAKKLIKEVLKEHAYSIEHVTTSEYGKFEANFIANDSMSRVLIQRQLSEVLGPDYHVTEPSQTQPKSFDLRIEGGNCTIPIELKRIRVWSNYSDYVTEFLNKIDTCEKTSSKNYKFLFLVACAHEFMTKWMLTDTAHAAVFNDYISKVIRSHYAMERVIARTPMEGKVLIVIEHILKDGEDSNSLISFCDEIKEKIDLNL
jgi:hypothetical protein